MNLREFFITNTWWGKLLGAFFGYLIAGPLGILFGLLIGNFFDKGFSNYYANPHWLYHTESAHEVQKKFFEATFFIMGYIAKADGRVSENEIKMARLLMDEMRLTKEQIRSAQHLFKEGKNADFKLDPILSQLKTMCSNNRGLLTLFIDIQYRAAQVDGLSFQKIQALNVVIQGLGYAPLNQQYRFYEDFSDTAYQQQQQKQQQKQSQHKTNYQQSSYQRPDFRTSNTLDHAYALLEVSPKASKQEVKRAYRRSMSINHPDKLIAQGLPQEMIKIANDKTQKIIKAYDLICKSKGW
ncbi:MAG: co-chaperone DjlA [Legionella sp.]|nr:co-chaperone DjlA [Legionella sp.]